ncbi:MAG: hypothetical protein WAU36_10900 [Cyclobacteriaceae bacterium]
MLRNKQFENKHRGKRAFVIVNGPSLKDQDINWLSDDITFVVSGFYRHEVIRKWQPTYYSIIDKNFFDGSEQSRNLFSQLNEVIKKSIFFIPLFRGLKSNELLSLLPSERTFYAALAGGPTKSVDFTGVVQSFYGVSAFALAQAIFMGCSPIYLLGFDHDYLANRGLDRHFYTGGTIPGATGNSKTLAERIPYDTEMEANLKLWKNYRSLKRIAEKKGIKIYNATNGGYLDVFERIDYNKLDK